MKWVSTLFHIFLHWLIRDVGLGKTIQVIAFLAHLKDIGKAGPHLIIVPSSTLDNWLREFSRFAPSLIVVSYYGSQAERQMLRYDYKGREDLDVVVTTYNMASGGSDDRKFLRRMEFQVRIPLNGAVTEFDKCNRHVLMMKVIN